MIRVALCFLSNLPTFVPSVWRHFRRNAPLCTRTCSEIDQQSGLPACRHNESRTFPDGRIVSQLARAATIRPSRFVGARCRADQSEGRYFRRRLSYRVEENLMRTTSTPTGAGEER